MACDEYAHNFCQLGSKNCIEADAQLFSSNGGYQPSSKKGAKGLGANHLQLGASVEVQAFVRHETSFSQSVCPGASPNDSLNGYHRVSLLAWAWLRGLQVSSNAVTLLSLLDQLWQLHFLSCHVLSALPFALSRLDSTQMSFVFFMLSPLLLVRINLSLNCT